MMMNNIIKTLLIIALFTTALSQLPPKRGSIDKEFDPYIEQWVKEAIEEAADKYIKNNLSEKLIQQHIQKALDRETSWGRPELNYEVKELAAKILAEKLEISVTKKED